MLNIPIYTQDIFLPIDKILDKVISNCLQNSTKGGLRHDKH